MSRRGLFYWCALLCGLTLTGAVSGYTQANNPQLVIEKTHGTEFDAPEHISITYLPGDDISVQQGYFDLLIQYDTTIGTIDSVVPGAGLQFCGWESFTWSAGSAADCGGSPCEPGHVRITARADLNDGPPAPTCLVSDTAELVVIWFHSTLDLASECLYYPVTFIWYDCGVNYMAEAFDADTARVADDVFMYDGIGPLTNPDQTFPTIAGTIDACLPGGIGGKWSVRSLDFYDGGVDFLCIDSIDARGDINLNDIAYEIADWVLFTNFLVLGPAVFYNPAVQTDASDVNANGVPLELNDLVYLYRVIIGDALPYPRPVISPAATAAVTQDGTTSSIRIRYPGTITTAWFVFGDSVVPTCAFATHVAAYDDLYTTPYTRVLVRGAQPFDSLTGFPPMDTSRVIINYTGNGTLLYAEVASDGLEYIPVSIDYINVPSCCQLRGNANGSGGIDVSDLTALVGFLFQGTFPPPPCPEEADVDASGGGSPITVSDITFLVSYLFQGGTVPPPCQ